MTGKTLQIGSVIAAVAFAGTVTGAVIASGNSSAGEGGFFGHLHMLGQHLHGGGGQHDHLAQMVERLDLTPDQLQRLEKVHEMAGAYAGHGSMSELHNLLMTQFERGQFGSAETRRAIDGHIEEMRVSAYAVVDELVALVGELDATERETLLRHLREAGAGDDGQGH